MDAVTKDKLTIQKTVEKLEHQVSESHIRIEELSRQVNEVTAQRVRLSTENSELIKEVHEYKVHLDNANHTKSQLAAQLEDSRRRLEDEERVRQGLERKCLTSSGCICLETNINNNSISCPDCFSCSFILD